MGSVGLALHMVHRYRSPRAGLIQSVVALRRADLTLRFTDNKNVIVDEAVLTGAFPYVARPARVMAILVLEGHLEIDPAKNGARPLVIAAGQAVLLPVTAMPQTKWTHTRHVDLEWEPAAGAPLAAKRLNVVDVDDLVEARGIADALQAAADQRLTLQRGFALFQGLGAPVNLSVDALHGAPDDRDLRLARAMEEQLTHLTTRATTLHLGDTAALSPRHMQRLVREFNARHGLNAGNWRDTRNRWRLQTAALLLSCPQVPITEVAKEVGYASVHALARAFATVGFPTPGALRRRVGGA